MRVRFRYRPRNQHRLRLVRTGPHSSDDTRLQSHLHYFAVEDGGNGRVLTLRGSPAR